MELQTEADEKKVMKQARDVPAKTESQTVRYAF